ncbi:VanZ family protein [Anaerosolibacter carboniphilus]|uniref:VanZ family protein n=1 Tax=Anaerosolibacter carboniphilus TaxID=1417629 RepID=A0A841KS38_9FIRM|nr:VanZ family protein [Anaerosolibacter carboniphilus]MBB6216386.1 VanZ family protein [Anaerosolibacter carboniphilus]
MKKIVAWVLVILWCGVIFYFSAEDRIVSHDRSSKIKETVEKVIVKVVKENGIDRNIRVRLEYYIRKTGHLLEYFILAVLVFNALWVSGIKGLKLYSVTFYMSLVYASLDEFHQSFVPGRGPQVSDVLLDGVGVAMGILLSAMLRRYRGHHIKMRS